MARPAPRPAVHAGTHLWHLKGFDLFEGLSPAELTEMERRQRTIDVDRGDVLYLAGDSADTVYVVARGLVKLGALSPDGREATLGYLEPGELFGELEVIEGTTRSQVASAHDDSRVHALPSDWFLEVMKRQAQFAFKVSVRLGQRMQQFNSKISCLLFKGAQSRLSELLLEFADRYGEVTPEGTRLRHRFSQREIANLIGVTRETVSHALQELRREGLIDVRNRHILLRRPALLARRV